MELKIEKYNKPQAIEFNFEELKQELAEKVKMYETLVYTDDQIKEAKADRASLNKLKTALNDERLRLEREYMQPFNEFKEKIGRKFESMIPVDYCYQDIADLPAPYTVPAGRTKPWGTAHATRAARNVVDGPFAVINADDFYGRDAFAKLAAFLSSEPADDGKMHLAMVGFRLDLTLSENGSVARGICDIAPDGKLRGVTEMTKLVKVGDIAENREDEANPVKVPLDSRVSMNFWGFPAGLFAELEERFPKWLAVNGSKEKSEWYIPFVVDELVREGKADCCVLPTDSSWFGVTYRDDKPRVMESIRALVDAGEYPSNLFA